MTAEPHVQNPVGTVTGTRSTATADERGRPKAPPWGPGHPQGGRACRRPHGGRPLMGQRPPSRQTNTRPPKRANRPARDASAAAGAPGRQQNGPARPVTPPDASRRCDSCQVVASARVPTRLWWTIASRRIGARQRPGRGDRCRHRLGCEDQSGVRVVPHAGGDRAPARVEGEETDRFAEVADTSARRCSPDDQSRAIQSTRFNTIVRITEPRIIAFHGVHSRTRWSPGRLSPALRNMGWVIPQATRRPASGNSGRCGRASTRPVGAQPSPPRRPRSRWGVTDRPLSNRCRAPTEALDAPNPARGSTLNRWRSSLTNRRGSASHTSKQLLERRSRVILDGLTRSSLASRPPQTPAAVEGVVPVIDVVDWRPSVSVVLPLSGRIHPGRLAKADQFVQPKE